ISFIRSSIFLVLLLGVAGAGLTEEEEATATFRPDEATRAGGVMEGLIHGTIPSPGRCCGLSILSAHASLRTFQIL
uniref:Uncharacterized protein n=1 Tax=Cyprinus carpio TaxID=7962 RepID=A0A8C1RZW7_CYPCA